MVETLSNVVVVDGRDDGFNDDYLYDKRGIQVTPKIILSADYQSLSRRAARAIMLTQAAKSDRRIQREVMELVADQEAKAAAAQLLGETLGSYDSPRDSSSVEMEVVNEKDEYVDMEGYS